jgi:hypothetical protein
VASLLKEGSNGAQFVAIHEVPQLVSAGVSVAVAVAANWAAE